ncbi:MAG TPA: FkbM family methyltransferase [Candidatus Eisenbacteria bacterium]|jgi:FkbM family methyltransferase|nr:FkbM family methyltransferase [Candidatus Eisenbacteria bacterium]
MKTAQLTGMVGRLPLISSCLRWCANQYAEGSIVKISQGHAAGFLWKRHHRYVNGYWIGHYEFPIQEALQRELKPGNTFYDVGANAGFFTLVAARLVGQQGKCIAFDPSPDNHASISEQIQLNGLSNCTAVMEAVAEKSGIAKFSFSSPGSSQGHLGESAKGEQQLEVDVTTLDVASERSGKPDFIKLDIEGGEAAALRGAARILRDIRPGWLIELHGAPCEQEVKKLLVAAGYCFCDLSGISIHPNQILPNHFVARPAKAPAG